MIEAKAFTYTYLRDLMCDAIETMLDYPEPTEDLSQAQAVLSKFMLKQSAC